MTEVVLDNQAGWSVAALSEYLIMEGVQEVDGRKLLTNGRFQYAVVHFDSELDAARFAEASNVAKKS
jgi:hypothetical protein